MIVKEPIIIPEFDLGKFWNDAGGNHFSETSIDLEDPATWSFRWLGNDTVVELIIIRDKHIAVFVNKEDQCVYNLLIDSNYQELVTKVKLLAAKDGA